MNHNAPLITFEGPDGAGKSTQIARAVALLEAMGYEVVCSREPGGTPLCEKIRGLLLDKGNTAMQPEAELLLYGASRAQHVREKILPALEAGKAVVLDRFSDSTVVFQGYARGLDMEMIRRVNGIATGGLTPDVTFVFLLEPEAARQRMAGKELDRIELEAESFHRRVYEGYCRLARENPDRAVALDARETIEALSDQVETVLRARIPKRP